MTKGIWIGLVAVALIIGLIAGYAIWGHKAGQVADLRAQVDQLTKENQDLKAKLSQSVAESAQASPAEQMSSAEPTQPAESK